MVDYIFTHSLINGDQCAGFVWARKARRGPIAIGADAGAHRNVFANGPNADLRQRNALRLAHAFRFRAAYRAAIPILEVVPLPILRFDEADYPGRRRPGMRFTRFVQRRPFGGPGSPCDRYYGAA